MKVSIEDQEGITVIRIAEKLDAATAPDLEDRFNEIIGKGIENAVISLKDLSYVSSAGLRVLLTFAKKLHSDQGNLCFADVSGNVKDVFEISGFYTLFKVYEGVEKAISEIET